MTAPEERWWPAHVGHPGGYHRAGSRRRAGRSGRGDRFRHLSLTKTPSALILRHLRYLPAGKRRRSHHLAAIGLRARIRHLVVADNTRRHPLLTPQAPDRISWGRAARRRYNPDQTSAMVAGRAIREISDW